MYSAWEGGARTPWLLQLALAPLCRYRHLWLARSSTLTSVARACPSTLASTTRASPSILPSASAADTCPSTLTSVRVLTRMLHLHPARMGTQVDPFARLLFRRDEVVSYLEATFSSKKDPISCL